MDANRRALYEAAGYFLSILGALVMGASVGLGLGAFMTRRRFGCGQWLIPPETGALNVTQACGDVLGAANTMILGSAVGGAIAFGCGLTVMVWLARDEEGEGDE